MRSLLAACFLVASASPWSWSLSKSSSPGPKVSGHACAASANPDKILLFGGLTGSAGSPTTADLWVYESGEGGWELLPGKAQGVSRPGRRMYAASAVLGRSFYLFGGWDPGEPGSGGKFLDDIWRLSLDTMKWDRVQANLPFPVSRHCACVVGPDTIAIHTFKGLLLFTSDGRDWSVTEQPTTGEGPDGLSMCASSGIGGDGAEGRQDVIIFGGSTRTQELSSAAFVLDTQSWTWKKLLQSGKQGESPPPIASSCAASLGGGNQCVIFGGASLGEDGYAGGLIPQDETWLLTVNGDSAEWEQIEGGGDSPEGRVAASLTTIGEELVLQGGWDPISKETYGEQTWILNK